MMDKSEIRTIIKYFWLKGYKPAEIYEEMRQVLGDEAAPASTTVKNWVSEFKRGRLCVQDEKRSGRPKEVTTLENITKVEDMIAANKQLKVADIAKAIGLSKERAFNILTNVLGMRKLANGWERIPQLDGNQSTSSDDGAEEQQRNESGDQQNPIEVKSKGVTSITGDGQSKAAKRSPVKSEPDAEAEDDIPLKRLR